MEDASAQIAAHALSVKWSDLPAPTRLRTLEFLGDSLAVGVAGRRAAFSAEVLASAGQWAAHDGGCFILGEPGVKLAPPYAAFVNAYQIHAQEYDCVHEPAVAHPMATVLAALMAQAAQLGGYRGTDFLAALVAGVDVVATLGMAAKGTLKFFRPATAGIFGCVAALARLRGLDHDTTRNAFGYALAYASGTMQAHVEGKPALALQVAGAARSAIEAVDLAVAGVPGPLDSIEGPFGLLSLFENDPQPAPDLGKGWRIDEVSWKPFPTGRAAHGAIVALRSLVEEQSVTTETLDRFEYLAPPLISRLVGRPARPDMSVAYARLCFPWLGALLLRDGEITLEAFNDKNLACPQLLAIAERIHVQVNENTDQAAFAPASGLAVLRDGRAIGVHVESQFGAPEWPLDEPEQMAKWKACLAFGGMPDREGQLKDLIGRFEGLRDVAPAIEAVLAK